MTKVTKELKDAPIPDVADAGSVKERLKGDHNVVMFSKLGTELLERTERPNIITLVEFEPFIPLFNADKLRYADDEVYRLGMNRLYNQYKFGLSINIYQPTIVVMSKEDPTELYFLDRIFTRFNSDIVDGKSKRESIPAAVAKTSSITRDNLVLDASIIDLMEANNTTEQKEYFARIRMDSALIQKNFVEKNLSPEKRQVLMDQVSGIKTADGPSESSSGMNFTLDDDD